MLENNDVLCPGYIHCIQSITVNNMCNIRYAKQSFTDKTAISVAVKAANWETGVCFKAVTLT